MADEQRRRPGAIGRLFAAARRRRRERWRREEAMRHRMPADEGMHFGRGSEEPGEREARQRFVYRETGGGYGGPGGTAERVPYPPARGSSGAFDYGPRRPWEAGGSWQAPPEPPRGPAQTFAAGGETWRGATYSGGRERWRGAEFRGGGAETWRRRRRPPAPAVDEDELHPHGLGAYEGEGGPMERGSWRGRHFGPRFGPLDKPHGLGSNTDELDAPAMERGLRPDRPGAGLVEPLRRGEGGWGGPHHPAIGVAGEMTVERGPWRRGPAGGRERGGFHGEGEHGARGRGDYRLRDLGREGPSPRGAGGTGPRERGASGFRGERGPGERGDLRGEAEPRIRVRGGYGFRTPAAPRDRGETRFRDEEERRLRADRVGPGTFRRGRADVGSFYGAEAWRGAERDEEEAWRPGRSRRAETGPARVGEHRGSEWRGRTEAERTGAWYGGSEGRAGWTGSGPDAEHTGDWYGGPAAETRESSEWYGGGIHEARAEGRGQDFGNLGGPAHGRFGREEPPNPEEGRGFGGPLGRVGDRSRGYRGREDSYPIRGEAIAGRGHVGGEEFRDLGHFGEGRADRGARERYEGRHEEGDHYRDR